MVLETPYCTQQTGCLTRGITLRAIHAAGTDPVGKTRCGRPQNPALYIACNTLTYVFARMGLPPHHSRLWNRPLVDQPTLPRKGEVALLDHLRADQHLQKRYYAVAAVLSYLLRFINPTTSWPTRLEELVATLPVAPGISMRHMGFPQNWTNLPLWRSIL